MFFQHFRIIGSGTEYRIDRNVVTPAEYTKKLESIGIFTKAKNFLVFQVNKSITYGKTFVIIFAKHYNSQQLPEKHLPLHNQSFQKRKKYIQNSRLGHWIFI